ncbi:hypothetical protein WISP_00559 [Willisornis vidua]|uniref:Uncharacterized protein n=1 Tax=Willisornis vidua TaxID=1566151 RepID=A0ABQ9E153_9PASS|nr:hypothetical protein WISP_00559 [Willisornis vidua]
MYKNTSKSSWVSLRFLSRCPNPAWPPLPLQDKVESERQKVLSWFQGLCLTLRDHTQELLAQLGHLERHLEKEQEENLMSLTQEISRLESWIQELEGKSREPARTFLQVGQGGIQETPKSWELTPNSGN